MDIFGYRVGFDLSKGIFRVSASLIQSSRRTETILGPSLGRGTRRRV